MTERVLVSVASAVASLLLMGSVAAAPADRVYGLPSDPLSEVWRLDQFDSGEIGLIGDTVSHQANVPSGVPLRRALESSQMLYDAPAALLARVLGPVAAYSVLVFLAFWTTALSAYFASRYLGIGPVGSSVAAALFTLTPAHMIEAQLHVLLALVFMLPVLLVLGIRVLERPSSRRGALFGAAVGLCAYFAAYLFLEAGTIAAGIAVAAIVRAVTDAAARAALGRAAASAILAAAVVLVPLAFVLTANRGTLESGLDRSLSEVTTFSLPLSAYLDPQTSLLGPVGLALALAGIGAGRLDRTRRLTLVLVGVVGLLVSLRPEISLLGVEISMPSKLIHSVIPYWRVFGRTSIVVALAGGILAGAVIDRIAASPRLPVRLASPALALLAVLALFDIVDRPSRPATDFGRPDRVSNVLRLGSGPVAEYPLFGFDNHQIAVYLARQLRHGRPLLNGSVEGTLSADLAWAANPADAPEAREGLTLAGVRTIVIHPGSPGPGGGGFRLLARTPDGASIYRVSPVAAPVIGSVRGGYPAETGPDGTPFQWLGPRASLGVVAGRTGRGTLSFQAVSPEVPRAARFGSAQHVISTAPTPIRLCVQLAADGTATVPISTDPAPRQLPGGDSRVAGIGVFRLRAEPGCR